MWSVLLPLEFAEILGRVADSQNLRIDVFNSIRAPLAQAIYLYILSRAHYATKDAPFEIALTNFLQQVSARLPPQESKRLEIFKKTIIRSSSSWTVCRR